MRKKIGSAPPWRMPKYELLATGDGEMFQRRMVLGQKLNFKTFVLAAVCGNLRVI